jgi:RNA polymerase sigma-70 factor, ECF subfamily
MQKTNLTPRDEELLSHARIGREWAWRRLFERDRDMIYRLAYRITLQREDALDVVQETFTKAFSNLHRLSDDEGWLPWLRTIGVRTALSRMRKLSRKWRLLGRKVEAEQTVAVVHAGPSARTLLEGAELQAALKDALKTLPPRQRAVASLALEEELSGAEIAETLGLRIGSVKSHLHRARKHLRIQLERFLPEERGNE